TCNPFEAPRLGNQGDRENHAHRRAGCRVGVTGDLRWSRGPSVVVLGSAQYLSAVGPRVHARHIGRVASLGLSQLPLQLRRLLFLVITSAVALCVAPLATPSLATPIGGYFGLAFWVLVTLVSGGAAVKLPGGALVSVTIAPLLAAAALGGPTAAVIV